MLESFFQAWIRRGGRSAGAARRRAALPTKKPRMRPTLEALEDRLVPTIVFNPVFGAEAYTGSQDGMQNPPVHLIFSGDDWNTVSGRQDEQQIITAAKNILSGPYLSGLKQYGSDGKATYVDSWNTSMNVPFDTTTGPDSNSVQNLLQLSISLESLGKGTTTDLPGTADLRHAPIYVVISDSTTSNSYAGGWNSASTYSESTANGTFDANIHMIWLGTRQLNGSVWQDGVTLGLSHELAETISDPTSNGNINPSSTLPAFLGASGGNQVGDYEPEPVNQPHYSYRLGADLVQPYWSKNDAAYIVPDGKVQKFYLQPVLSDNTFSGQYDLNFSLASNDQITISQSANPLQVGGVAVNLNSATASFDARAINNINVGSGGGQHYVNVAGLPNAVTLNITGGSPQSKDTVTVGSTGSLANVAGLVNVSNTSGQTRLIVSDANDAVGQFGVVTSDSVLFTGMARVNYTGGSSATSGVISLEVDGGKGGNIFDVDDTAANTPLTLSPGAQSYGVGGNAVNIWGSSSAVTVKSTASDFVVVGNGSLASIGGPVNVSNVSGGADSLTIDDSADSDARSINITGNAVRFAATDSAPAVTVNYTPPSSGSKVGVNQLTILDAPFANAITIDSVSAQALVTIDGDTQDVLTGAAANKVRFNPVQT